ncbi:MAG: hypothetical protein PVJ19_21555, partial [Desulfobacteraceae bacterium]
LSAAMPGLAGAIFRKKGLHATLRTPTPAFAANQSTTGPLTVTLKLFNRIAREKGTLLLSEGVVLASSSLFEFLKKRPELFGKIRNAAINSEPLPLKKLPGAVLNHEYVILFVCTGNSTC